MAVETGYQTGDQTVFLSFFLVFLRFFDVVLTHLKHSLVFSVL